MNKREKATKSPTVKRQLVLTAAEHMRLDELGAACAEAGIATSKADLLRAAVALLGAQPFAQVVLAWNALAPASKRRARKRRQD